MHSSFRPYFQPLASLSSLTPPPAPLACALLLALILSEVLERFGFCAKTETQYTD